MTLARVGRAANVPLLAAWLGAALIVSAAVAPAAFAVLPSRQLAGALVGRVLPPVFIAGFVIGSFSSALTWRAGRNVRLRVNRAAGAMLAVCCFLDQFIIGVQIDRLRTTIPGAVEALAVTDPRRVIFGRLHLLSVLWLGVAMVAALVAIVAATPANERTTSQ